MFEYLLIGRVFMFAVADVWDDAAVVQRFSHRFGAVADSAVLAEEGSFVRFAFGDRVTLLLLIGTRERKT